MGSWEDVPDRDGLDVGYQSTTVSFLAKIYRDNQDPELLKRVLPVCKLLTHFFYPNGHFAGMMGCRQTLPPELEREFVVVEFALPGK